MQIQEALHGRSSVRRLFAENERSVHDPKPAAAHHTKASGPLTRPQQLIGTGEKPINPVQGPVCVLCCFVLLLLCFISPRVMILLHLHERLLRNIRTEAYL